MWGPELELGNPEGGTRGGQEWDGSRGTDHVGPENRSLAEVLSVRGHRERREMGKNSQRETAKFFV